jgi:hypothetical protein
MFVPDSASPETRVACYQLPDGTLGALEALAWASFRQGLDLDTAARANVIWIAARMGYARKAAVQDALVRLTVGGGGLAFGAHQLALLRHNILAWEGPAFAGVACTGEMVDRLDPDEPLPAFALEEIARRNPMRRSPDPKARGASGSPAAGARLSTDATRAT